MAVFGEPLKSEYHLNGTGYDLFYQTGEVAESYSMMCDMGKAVPDPKKKNWFLNKPIYGLTLELRAKAAQRDYNNDIKPMGFVVIVKDKDVLITFKPIGEYVDGQWEGDTFNSWSGNSTDIKIFNERFGESGYASFNLLDGNGFYYKNADRDKPDYFLSKCKRIKKSNLPVYDWKYTTDVDRK